MKGNYAKDSNVATTILRSVIRDEVGHYKLRQCRPVTHYKKPVSQHILATNRKTTGDILNKLHYNNHLRSIVTE